VYGTGRYVAGKSTALRSRWMHAQRSNLQAKSEMRGSSEHRNKSYKRVPYCEVGLLTNSTRKSYHSTNNKSIISQ